MDATQTDVPCLSTGEDVDTRHPATRAHIEVFGIVDVIVLGKLPVVVDTEPVTPVEAVEEEDGGKHPLCGPHGGDEPSTRPLGLCLRWRRALWRATLPPGGESNGFRLVVDIISAVLGLFA